MKHKADKVDKVDKVDKRKPFYKKWWFGTSIAAVLVLVMVLVATLDYSLVAVGIKIACKPGKSETPVNYADIMDNTKFLAQDLSYNSAYENGTMDIIAPKNVTGNQPVLVYIHGGYYVGGDKKSGEVYCRIIANAGYVVANINYMLAPKAKYPVQAKQANEAIAFLRQNADTYNIDPDQIFIGGDSAGGHLSSQLGAFYSNEELQSKMNFTPAISASQLKGVLLLCGFYDAYTVRDSKFPFLNTAMWSWTDVRNYESYSRWGEINTISWVTKNYPATFITCGYDDPFYVQAQAMVTKLRENSVETTAYLPKNDKYKLKHEFQREFEKEEANIAMERTLSFMNANSELDKVEQQIFANFTFSTGETVKVKLMKKYAPISVENFIKYANAGFYDNTVIHRVITNKVVQGGGYNLDQEKKAPIGEAIVGEFASNGYGYNKLSHLAGVISMARTSVFDSATSEFFFCVTDCSYYDGEYAAFGKIVEGLEFIDTISSSPVSGDKPKNTYIISSVTISHS